MKALILVLLLSIMLSLQGCGRLLTMAVTGYLIYKTVDSQ